MQLANNINARLGFDVTYTQGGALNVTTYVMRSDNFGRLRSGLPKLIFTIQGVNITLLPEDYSILDITGFGTPIYASSILGTDPKYVDPLSKGSITGTPVNMSEALPIIVLGNAFLRKFYTIFKFGGNVGYFDREGNRWLPHQVGLALANRDPALPVNLSTTIPATSQFLPYRGSRNGASQLFSMVSLSSFLLSCLVSWLLV
jgi:hypothetical protein